jgi:hypothetical protein
VTKHFNYSVLVIKTRKKPSQMLFEMINLNLVFCLPIHQIVQEMALFFHG